MTAAQSSDIAAPERIRSASHTPSNGRPCVHLLTPEPPAVMMLDWTAVARLNFQPRICTAPMTCIATRIGDILTIAFDSRRRDVSGPHHAPKRTNPALRWHYQLHGTPNPNVVAAVMIPPSVVVRDAN